MRIQLTTCCGCCSVKTGTILIGALTIVCCVCFLLVICTSDDVEWIQIIDADKTITKTTSAISYCIIILISTLLIIGNIKQNATMMLPWMILNMLNNIYLVINLFFADLVEFFVGLAFIMLNIYLWLVVYSHFQELRNGSRNCAQEQISMKNCIIIEDPARPQETTQQTQNITAI